MTAFNEVATNAKHVKYYSFGAVRKELQLSELLRANFEVITEHAYEVQTDGLVRLEDMKWGKYLVTFDHDHLEVAGFNPKVRPGHIANLLVDNLRMHEKIKAEK